MSKDLFKHKAGIYDTDAIRVSNVDNIANAVIQNTDLNAKMHLMDFGAGTGLLLERVAPHVKKITAVDVSKSMIENLESKRSDLSCELDILNIDLTTTDIDQKFEKRFDGIISSMTMHHVKDVEAMFVKFYEMLEEGGVIAIADLDKEDGSFHKIDTGIYHYGFERDAIEKMATQAGFTDVNTVDASIARKPYDDYPVFLLTAKK